MKLFNGIAVAAVVVGAIIIALTSAYWVIAPIGLAVLLCRVAAKET